MKKRNWLSLNKAAKSAVFASFVAGSLMLSGCGSSSDDSADSSSSAIVNKGVITGFGSVYVNGIKFETDDSEFDIDNKTETTQANLRVGMVVTINGTVNSDGKTGKATFIQYDNELKGPISSITVIDLTTKEIVVLGRTITVTTDTVFDDDSDLTFDTLAINIIIEVSGLVTATGITATHIEQQDGTNSDGKIEILGPVASITGSTLDDFEFQVHGFDVQTDGSTELDDLTISDMVNGLFVEVKGTLNGAGTLLTASKIELKKKGLGKNDADEAEVEGVVTAYDSVANTFEIQGQAVDASNATLSPSSLIIADGITVEAEGEIVDGVLIAEKVKQKGNKIKIKANVTDVDTVNETISFSFNSVDIVVRVNAQTEMEDENDDTMTLADLVVGDFVKMKAFYDGTSTINAIELEIKNSNEVEIEAPVDTFDSVNNTVTVLGSVFDLSQATFNSSAVSSTFYDELGVGVFIELKDDDNDGAIDEVEIDD